jgi:hypothetical protein
MIRRTNENKKHNGHRRTVYPWDGSECIISSLLVMLRVIEPFGVIQVTMNAPIGLQEMVLAVWLIAKGFDPKAVASSPDPQKLAIKN